MDIIVEKTKDIIAEVYMNLKSLPKPQAYRMGGTYYGGTQLFSSVGNHLDLLQGEPYTSYGYGCNINYSEIYGIRLGGAYKTDEVGRLVDFLRENAKQITDAGWTGIEDYGTNFSTYGIARR